MADSVAPIDLSTIPVPNIVETLDFETIYADMSDELAQLDPSLANLSESDPLAKLLQVCAYRELIIRNRINLAVRSVFLTTATGSDLDNLVANEPYNLERLQISAGDPDAVPPVPPTYETDEELRQRAQLAPRRYSTAGPASAYKFWALSAHGDIADVSIHSPAPTEVHVTVLTREGNGIPHSDVLTAVENVLNNDEIRPLTDLVTVQGPTPVGYSIDAVISIHSGPDSEVVLNEANARLDAFLERNRLLNVDITRAGIIAALYVGGVKNVLLNQPSADVTISENEVAYVTSRNIESDS